MTQDKALRNTVDFRARLRLFVCFLADPASQTAFTLRTRELTFDAHPRVVLCACMQSEVQEQGKGGTPQSSSNL